MTTSRTIRIDGQWPMHRGGCLDSPTMHRPLANRFRKIFHLQGTPVRMVFKTSDNPYKGRRNKLTPRQQRKRERLMKHVKKH